MTPIVPCDRMGSTMAAFMEIGDIWQYGPDEDFNYYICLGSKMIEGDRYYELYKLHDVEFTYVYEYGHFRFERAIRENQFKLISRINKDA